MSFHGLKDTSLPQWTCNRCGHTWRSKLKHQPVGCAKCYSDCWNRPRRQKPEERFWTYVEKAASCWRWKGGHNRLGYGKCRLGAITTGAHRAAYQLTHGQIPQGLWVLHRCDVPDCVNPEHLFLGTAQDNTDDMWQKGRGSRQPRTSLPGEKNPSAKLTEAEVKKIRKQYAVLIPNATKLATEDALSQQFKVSKSQIRNIITGKNWPGCE